MGGLGVRLLGEVVERVEVEERDIMVQMVRYPPCRQGVH